jgi:hypothetical protein
MVMMVVMSACGGGTNNANLPTKTRVVELPGAADEIDFDDIAYSPRLQRVLVPARDSGLYLVEPDTATATRVPGTGNVASVDEGRGVLFLANRSASTLTAVNPVNGAVLSSVRTSASPDYVRYVDATGELWVTEPVAAGIEILTVSDGPTLVVGPVAFIAVPNGPEGFAIDLARKAAYTHAGNDLIVIDLVTRVVTARWRPAATAPTGSQESITALGLCWPAVPTTAPSRYLMPMMASSLADSRSAVVKLCPPTPIVRATFTSAQIPARRSPRSNHPPKASPSSVR